jgi:hypothetical protein
MSIDLIADGPTQVLKLEDYNQSRSVYRDVRRGSMADTFEVVNIDSEIEFSLSLDFAGIGISVINQQAAVSSALTCTHTEPNNESYA